MFLTVDDAGLKNEAQETIRTSWKIILDAMSETARIVIAAIALIETNLASESILNFSTKDLRKTACDISNFF